MTISQTARELSLDKQTDTHRETDKQTHTERQTDRHTERDRQTLVTTIQPSFAVLALRGL